MTTIREHAERGDITPEMIEFFWKNRGAIPLCCFETNSKNKVRCGHTKRYLPMDEFKYVCLGCQKQIAEMLRNLK